MTTVLTGRWKMSVLIKGAKPPSGCRWCYFNEDCKCALIVGCDFDDTNGTHRRKDCPLIELPDHGDLIDRDELKAALGITDWECEKCQWGGQFGCEREDFSDACFFLENAEAVIPAERNEDETN